MFGLKFLTVLCFVHYGHTLELSVNLIPDYFMDIQNAGHSCGATLTSPNGYIYSHQQTVLSPLLGATLVGKNANYDDSIDCTINIDVEDKGRDYRIMFSFPNGTNLANSGSGCDEVTMYDGSLPNNDSVIATLCGPIPSISPLTTFSPQATLHFKANGDGATDIGFKIFYTAFYITSTGTCNGTDFFCDYVRCIPPKFRCDSTVHCEDAADESKEIAGCRGLEDLGGMLLTLGMNTMIIILACVLVIVLFILAVLTCMCCRKSIEMKNVPDT